MAPGRRSTLLNPDSPADNRGVAKEEGITRMSHMRRSAAVALLAFGLLFCGPTSSAFACHRPGHSSGASFQVDMVQPSDRRGQNSATRLLAQKRGVDAVG